MNLTPCLHSGWPVEIIAKLSAHWVLASQVIRTLLPLTTLLIVALMKKISLTLVALASLSAAVASAQAPAAKGDPAAGRQKAIAICSGCHGIPGTKTGFPEVYHVPKIGGQSEAYLVAALKAYRAGERYNATMKALASSLTEKEMADIAAYYARGVSAK